MESSNHGGRLYRPSCSAPKGKTYLTIGQDFNSVEEYVLSQYNASLHRVAGHGEGREFGKPFQTPSTVLSLAHFEPACTMTYTSIQKLEGLDQPAEFGSGIQYALGLAEAFPESGLQIGLWLDGYKGCRKIVSGVLDENIYWLFDFIQLRLPKQIPKVFLRVGYEFDNPSFGYSDDPEAYKEAFRHIVRVCESRMIPNICHDKIVFVWHSWAAPRKPDVSLEQFYPGDSYVDWVGISIFQQLYPWANDDNWIYRESDFAGGNMNAVKEVLEYAKARGKQTMIAESTPFGGFNVTKSSIAKKYIKDDTINNDIWNMWFQKTIDLINEYDISMWSYINCDWDNQPMWKYAGFGNTLLSSSEVVMSQWWDRILANNSRFLLRLGKCDESPLPIGSKMIQAQKLSPTQQKLTRNSALATILNLNDDQDSFITPNNGFLYLICAGSVMMMILIGTKIFQGNRNQKAETPLTTPSLSLSGSNRLSEYGSLDE